MHYINECNKKVYDFEQIFSDKGWRDVLILPAKQEDLISYGYQLLQYILDGPKNLIALCMGYTGSNKFSDNIEAFMRKSIEPFVVAIRTYIELEFIDCEDVIENTKNKMVTIFMSYCQKDADLAFIIKQRFQETLEMWSIMRALNVLCSPLKNMIM